MKKSKIVCGVLVMACAMLVVTPAVAGDGAEGGKGKGVCRTDGAWIGESPAWGMKWLIVYDSDSYWEGSFTTRWIGGEASLGGSFPDAVTFSNTVGTWVRTGRRTFQYTMVTYGLDVAGQPVYIAKNSGFNEVSGNCDYQETFDSAISLYDPSQDPFGDDPPTFGCVADPSVSTATRMYVDPPCEP